MQSHPHVAPSHRHRGHGAQLVRLLEAQASEAGIRLLRLRTDRRAAALFYERLGYDAISDASATHERWITTD